jgi:molecular chaperone GrpE
LADEASAFRQRAQLAEDRLAEVLDAYRTLKRDNEGHRERVTRNIERRFEQRRENLLLRFIDILDNLDRALEAAEASFVSNALVEGLILVRTQLLQTLQDEGLERIPVLSLPYDPHVSEAVQTMPVAEPEQHHAVMKELLRGYRLNGRVARASRVVVGEYTRPQAESPATPASATDTAPDVAVPAPEGLSLEEIIARAEAQEAPPAAPEPTGGAARALAEAADDLADDELPDDLSEYVGEGQGES